MKTTIIAWLKTNIKYIIIGAAVLSVLWYLYAGITPSINKETAKANAALQLRIDSLGEKNRVLFERIQTLEASQQQYIDLINKNQVMIHTNNQQLEFLKEKYHAKIIHVDSYNAHALDSFFSSRYH